MQAWLSNLAVYLSHKTWIGQIFITIVATAVVSYLVALIVRRLERRAKKTKNHWDELLLKSFNKPAQVFIWVMGLAFAGDIARVASQNAIIFNALTPFREIGIVLALVWFIVRVIHFWERHYSEPGGPRHRKFDITTIQALGKLLRISVLITAVLVLLQTLGLQITGVLAFGGIGGLALSLAAKDMLANFFGGMMLYMDRPFRVGEWIASPDRTIEGTVEEIGWRLTRIRTFDKQPLYVPNSLFSTMTVINPSRMRNRRIKVTIGVRYDDWRKIGDIVNDVEAMLKSHPEIDTHQTCFVKLVEFGPSSLNFLVYTFTKTTEWIRFQGVQQDVFLKILAIIDNHGAECAFPTTTLHVPDGIQVKHEPAPSLRGA